MFGVEKPVKDMVKEDVLNRLIMFGAFMDSNEQVVFTNATGGLRNLLPPLPVVKSFARELGEAKSIIFVFKLIHRGNKEYYDAFSRFYAKNRGLRLRKKLILRRSSQGAWHYSVTQQERMKIDVMYRHAENKLVVDEYRDLAHGFTKDTPHASWRARRTRSLTLV